MPSLTWPELVKLGHAAQAEIRASQIADYLFIGGQSMSARAAAARLGVAPRTIQRYRRHLRGGQPACPASTPGAAAPHVTHPAAASPPAPTPKATAATPTGPAVAAAAPSPQDPK